jgi:hypothetical protein
VSVDDVRDRGPDAGVDEDVEVAVLDVLDLLLGEQDRLATFLMLIEPCPNSPPVTGFLAPSPTNAAVGAPSQIGKFLAGGRGADVAGDARPPACFRIALVRISPCASGIR